MHDDSLLSIPCLFIPGYCKVKPWLPTSLDKSYGINSTFA
ncbi:hypothetical protein HMPREF9544_04028 [Escherichia coli MS 153-1]|nr:hypothetical protein HMPREF9544_04028 [Escherichia coli MS 153-1]EFU56778.1 hypothetical protein HMPREF9545_03461 [Escherichia coli MS 16-3]EGB84091.1 hypothetical protein HMPREF9533_01081 [Escherichia coli MS 60-1]EKI34367.1 hypothetical protein EC07798_4831 [Escherichia coli 07798]ESD40938.1 hypothetical protein HMPREF1604_02476 [Escherichia coli 908519]ESE20227.1 hypothetical protein HMPREF1618_02404 [Escherichia coli 908691]ESE22639.1 hypothetical protein HMPREF1623_02622 [Escherichia 